MPKARKPSELAKHRLLIAELYLKGYTMMALKEVMADEHNVELSIGTIHSDLKVLQKEWHERSIESIDKIKARELAKIDKVEIEFWQGWERSKKEFKAISSKEKAIKLKGKKEPIDAEEIERTKKVEERVGDSKFLFGVLKCIEERCQILGIQEVGNVNLFQNVTFAQFIKQYHVGGDGKYRKGVGNGGKVD